ncbi:adenosylcobinamide-GDP ribazoletransferase [Shewanella sp. NIFS-20-20]|uniref:adenosylcobinamide-GDP ribazoletransferase n=1 Tax=Shewanella sp. NIFS-20-20 TaxID=2853806 RepID=UPI001C43E2B1|nr:adenosylcobinamide-GDP ribazoletransferase [Shewanella sp. NIFS-20-20]MBV7314746.1 adenosylcobinamide-GDP ribazoletransferase [Shewanella sp. NIFS-20-20]
MMWLIQQWQLFLIAIGFFTRIPVPQSIQHDSEKLNRASRYFGVVGLVIAGVCALVMCGLAQLLPLSLAVVISMIVSVLLTGAFHEDGLADSADGFGGGWQVSDKLAIMKDSRLGTYGAVTLMLILLLKWQALLLIAEQSLTAVALALVLAHGLSRVLAATIIFSETYVRDEGKSKPLANQQQAQDLAILLVTAAGLMLWLLGCGQALGSVLWLILSLVVTRQALVYWFRRQIGGYTGDTLGAAQQISEVLVYLVLLVTGLPYGSGL